MYSVALLISCQVRRDAAATEENVFAPLKLAQASLDQIKDFKENLPTIHILCNPGLRQRHWEKVSPRERATFTVHVCYCTPSLLTDVQYYWVQHYP